MISRVRRLYGRLFLAPSLVILTLGAAGCGSGGSSRTGGNASVAAATPSTRTTPASTTPSSNTLPATHAPPATVPTSTAPTSTAPTSTAPTTIPGVPTTVPTTATKPTTTVPTTTTPTATKPTTTVPTATTTTPTTPATSPSLVGMGPMSGAVGTLVAIVVLNAGPTASVSFNGLAAPIVQTTNLGSGQTEFEFYVPQGASSGNVSISTGGVSFVAGAFSVSGSTTTTTPTTPTTPTSSTAPAFVSMSPMVGAAGTYVAIVVANPGSTASLTFNGVATQLVNASSVGNGEYQLDFYVPAGVSSGAVIVTTGGVALSAGTFTVSGSSTTTPTTTTTNPSALMVATAFLEDTNGDHVVSAGDQLTVTFNGAVSVNSNDPTGQIALLVPGDSFGQGATMAPGSSSSQVVITLGTGPHIKVTGTFDPVRERRLPLERDRRGAGLQRDRRRQRRRARLGRGDRRRAAPRSSRAPTPRRRASNYARGLHTATLLDDGRLLIVGGVSAPAAGQADFQLESEIYDPVAGTFTAVSDASLGGNPGGYLAMDDSAGNPFASGRFAHVAIKILDGTSRVLIAGGHGFEQQDDTQNPPDADLLRARDELHLRPLDQLVHADGLARDRSSRRHGGRLHRRPRARCSVAAT